MMITFLRIWVLTLGVAVFLLGSSEATKQGVAGYLPPSSSVLECPSALAGQSGMLYARSGAIALPNSHDLAFLYEQRGHVFLRVVVAGVPHDTELEGAYVSVFSAGCDGLQVRDLIHQGTEQILVVTANSASLGSFLQGFRYTSNGLVNLTGVPIDGYRFQLVQSPSGSYEIVAYGKWVDHRSSTANVYEWGDGAFVQTDRDADQYVLAMIQKLAAEATSKEKVSAGERILPAERAASEYNIRGEHAEAASLYQQVLELLADPGKTEEAGQTAPLNSRRLLALDYARLHRELGDTYAAFGRNDEASREYKLSSTSTSGR
jgi:hypothetical protein